MILLHILWMILRFLLIVVGILLGLLLVILLLALFCPIRYRASVTKETESFKEITGNASVSWLFRGVCLLVTYREGKLQPDIRLFGVSLLKVKNFLTDRKKRRDEAAIEKKKKAPPKPAEKKAEDPAASRPEVVSAEQKEQGKQTESPPVTAQVETKKTEAVKSESVKPEAVKPEAAKPESVPEEKEPLIFRLLERIAGWIKKLLDKITGLIRTLQNTFRSLMKKLRQLGDRIDYWRTFLSHPRVKQAIALVWKKLIRLLKHVMPTRLAGELAFGFEDPSVTGWILMIMGMTIPLHKNTVRIHPDFEGNNHIEGNVWLKGRIYGIVVLAAALRILADKNIRYVYRRLKNKQEE